MPPLTEIQRATLNNVGISEELYNIGYCAIFDHCCNEFREAFEGGEFQLVSDSISSACKMLFLRTCNENMNLGTFMSTLYHVNKDEPDLSSDTPASVLAITRSQVTVAIAVLAALCKITITKNGVFNIDWTTVHPETISYMKRMAQYLHKHHPNYIAFSEGRPFEVIKLEPLNPLLDLRNKVVTHNIAEEWQLIFDDYPSPLSTKSSPAPLGNR